MRIHCKTVVKQESEEDVRYTMTWKNSVCTENHHYVIDGKLNSRPADTEGTITQKSVEFTSNIYPKNPGNSLKSTKPIVINCNLNKIWIAPIQLTSFFFILY